MNIQKVAQLTGLSAHTLRYYEKIGLLLNIARNTSGHRNYSGNDLVWIEFIKRLKATNMPLSEMKRFAELRSHGDGTIAERVAILENHQERVREQMEQLQLHQEKIKQKIAICKQGGLPDQRKLKS
jgi:DNA-binding transcriptional MerR regulator